MGTRPRRRSAAAPSVYLLSAAVQISFIRCSIARGSSIDPADTLALSSTCSAHSAATFLRASSPPSAASAIILICGRRGREREEESVRALSRRPQGGCPVRA